MSELRVDGLAKRYRRRDVVRGVSLDVRSGEVIGLLGPNGAGKTTCFYMIVGLIPADDGRISLDGDDLTPLPMHARARLGVGYLPQEASVFRKLSVADNVLAVLQTRRDLDRDGRAEQLELLLRELQITHLRDRGIGVLITDHNVRETLGICGRAYILSDGAVIASGSADDVLADEQVRKVYLGEHFRL